MRFRFAATVSALLLLTLAAHARGQGAAPADQSLRLRGADGKTYDLAGMRGQVVLVSFGATWCQPCKEELKALEQLKKEYREKPVKFLWVSIESEDEVSDSGLKDYAKKLKISFPVLRDPYKETFARFSPRLRLPTILFFGKDGRLSTPNHVGMAETQLYLSKMRARLDQLLGSGGAGAGGATKGK